MITPPAHQDGHAGKRPADTPAETAPPVEEGPFVRTVRRQAERAQRRRRLTFWEGLTVVGSVGWMVALPPVGGALVGRWLDQLFHPSPFSFTLSLLLLGLALGCASAWRHVRQALRE